MIAHLADRGLAVVLISSRPAGALAMSDRIRRPPEGALVAELARAEATQEKVMMAASQQRREASA